MYFFVNRLERLANSIEEFENEVKEMDALKLSKTNPEPETSCHTPEVIKAKKKLYCACQLPFDNTKIYLKCRTCKNMYHESCVFNDGNNPFICEECKIKEKTQDLYCYCKTPYDNSK